MYVGCWENVKQNWFPLLLNFLLLVAIAVHGIVYAYKLPSEVVYHYDAYGNADQYTATRTFIAIYWASALISTILMWMLSIIFAMNCCAVSCTAPEEASYPPAARRYLRLVVSGWAVWLNLAILILILTVFAVLLQNALKAFDSATTFGVYMPFFVFCALLVVLVYWMFARIQAAKRLIYSGFFPEEKVDANFIVEAADHQTDPLPGHGDDQVELKDV